MKATTRKLALIFLSTFLMLAQAQNIAHAAAPRKPVTGWKQSYSYSSWKGCGAGSVAGETDGQAINGMLDAIQANTGCRPAFVGLDTAPAAAAGGGWPSPERKLSMNLCHGWTSNEQIYPQLFAGTDQEQVNKTCAHVTFPPNCRPCESYPEYAMNFVRTTVPICPSGYAYSGGGFCSCSAINGSYSHCGSNDEADAGPMCEDSESVDDESNPFNVGTGSKYTFETDYIGSGSNPLVVRRYYDSRTPRTGMFGQWWGSNYDLDLNGLSEGFLAVSKIKRPSGRTTYGSTRVGAGKPTVTYPTRSSVDDFYEAKDANGVRIGWSYRDTHRQQTEFYGIDGKIKSITNEVGQKLQIAQDPQGRIGTVTDSEGRKLTFVYDNANRVVEIITPHSIYSSTTGTYSRTIQYAYNSIGAIIAVKRPNGGIKGYLYENPNMPHALTGIVDERGKRTRIWTYDSITGLVTGGGYGGGAGSSVVGGVSLSRTPGSGLVMATKGGGNGGSRATSYVYGNVGDSTRLLSVSGDSCANCGRASKIGVKKYGANDMPSERTYSNGRRDTFTYTPSRLPATQTLAAGTTAQTVRTTSWNESTKKPNFTENEFLRVEFTYNSYGAIETKKEIDKAPGGAVRLHRYTYANFGGVPRLQSYTNPRGFVTVYAYKANGDIQTVTNALGHVTTIEKNAAGDVAWVRDPNGLVTNLTYDENGRITALTQGTRVTSVIYDKSGRITSFTTPDKSSFTFLYDDIGRLTRVTTNFNDYQTFEYDSAGNRTGMSLYGSANQLVNSMRAQFNYLGQVEKLLSAAAVAQSTLTYDTENNVKEIKDAFGVTANNSFDVMNRLTERILPNGARTTFEYDKGNRLVKLTDSNNATTSFEYDGFGNILKAQSSDAGTRLFAYDLNGNQISITDGFGKVTTTQYDALDRPIRTTPIDPKLATQMIYDEGANGKGRLTTVRDINGFKAFFYNVFGDVIATSQTVANMEYRTFYAFDSFGRNTSIAYPSGRIINYIYGATTDRILGVTLTQGGITTNLATNITYAPFGMRTGFTYGNGKIVSTTFNQELLPSTRSTTGLESKTFIYDAASQLKQVSDSLVPAANESYTFGSVGELKTAVGPFGSKTFYHDGNRNLLGGPTAQPSPNAAVFETGLKTFDNWSTYIPTWYYSFVGSTLTRLSYNSNWASVRTNKVVTAGKWYWEVEVGNLPTVPVQGAGVMVIGMGASNAALDIQFAGKPNGWGMAAYGSKVNNDVVVAFGQKVWVKGDTIGVALDVDTKVLRFYVNGAPANGTDGIAYTGFTSTTGFTPMIAMKGATASAIANFGNRPFKYTPPAGFLAYDTTAANFLSEPLKSGTYNYDPGVNYTISGTTATKKITHTTSPSVRINKPITSGKWYWEATYTPAAATTDLNRVLVGVAEAKANLSTSFFAGPWGYGYHLAGLIYYNNSAQSGWPVYNAANGDVISILFDADNGKLYFYRNGVPMPKIAPDGLAYSNIPKGTYYPAAVVKYVGDSVKLNLGQEPFKYAPRDASFKPLDANGTDGIYPFSNRLRAGVYTANGNLAKYGSLDLIYNDFDRLSVVQNGTAVVAKYLYNVDGLRTVKQSGGYTTGYVYDEVGQMIGEYDGSGRMLKEYFYLRGERIAMAIPNAASNVVVNTLTLPDAARAASLNSLLTSASLFESTISFMSSNIRQPEREGIYFYHNDIKKTPKVISDISGATVWQASYDPFGRTTIQTAVISNNHRYSGQYFDAETGLHQNGQRDYDPASGRYLQYDPIGIEGGLNPYAYAEADPINSSDPTGTTSLEEHFAHRPDLFKYYVRNIYGRLEPGSLADIKSGKSFPVVMNTMGNLIGGEGNGSGIHVKLSNAANVYSKEVAGAVRLTQDAAGKWVADVSGYFAKSANAKAAVEIAEVFRAVGIEVRSITGDRLAAAIASNGAAGFATLEFLGWVDGMIAAYMAGHWIGEKVYNNYCTDIADVFDKVLGGNDYDPNAGPQVRDRVRMDKATWFRPRPRPVSYAPTVRG